MEACKRILVADDNDDIRETLVETLRLEGYEVDSARDGREALRKLGAQTTRTLVLLDLMMPGMTGWDFLEKKREIDAINEHPVVTISAVGENRPGLSLAKPISHHDLLETVRRYCGSRE